MGVTKQLYLNVGNTMLFLGLVASVGAPYSAAAAERVATTLASSGDCNSKTSTQSDATNSIISLILRVKKAKVGDVSVIITETNLTDQNLEDSSVYENGIDKSFSFNVTDEDGKEVARIPPLMVGGSPLLFGEFFPSDIMAKSSKQIEIPLSRIYKLDMPGRYVIRACRLYTDVKDSHGKLMLVSSNSITIYLSE